MKESITGDNKIIEDMLRKELGTDFDEQALELL